MKKENNSIELITVVASVKENSLLVKSSVSAFLLDDDVFLESYNTIFNRFSSELNELISGYSERVFDVYV